MKSAKIDAQNISKLKFYLPQWTLKEFNLIFINQMFGAWILFMGIFLSLNSFFTLNKITGIQAYSIFILISLGFCIFFSSKKQTIVSLKKNDLVLAFALSLGFLFYYLSFCDLNSIGGNEYSQIVMSREKYLNNIVLNAAREDQPPLSYLSLSIIQILFGDSVLSLRSLAYVPAALTVGFSFIICRILKLNWIISLIAAFFLGLNNYFSLYAVEARPYAISILAQMYFVFCLLNFYKFSSLRNALILSISMTLYLWSISIQSGVFIFTLCLILVPYCLFYKKNVKKAASLVFAAGLSVAFFIPNLIVILQAVKARRTDIFSKLDTMSYFSHQNFENYKFVYTVFTDGTTIAFFAVLAITLFFSLIDRREKYSENYKLFLFTCTLIIIYPIIIVFVFTSISEHHLAYRYFLNYVPVMALCFALFFNQCMSHFGGQKTRFLTLALLVVIGARYFQLNLSESKMDSRTDWRVIYNYLNKSKKPTYAFLLNLMSNNDWYQFYFVGPEQYKKNNNVSLLCSTDNNYYQKVCPYESMNLLNWILNNKKIKADFLLIQQTQYEPGNKIEQKSISEILNIEVIDLPHFSIIKFKGVENFEVTYLNFMTKMNEVLPKKGAHHHILDFLINYYLKKGNQKMAHIYIEEFEQLKNVRLFPKKIIEYKRKFNLLLSTSKDRKI